MYYVSFDTNVYLSWDATTDLVMAQQKSLFSFDYPPGSPFENVHKYYAACMDEDTIEELGALPAYPLLDMVDAIETHADLDEVLAKMTALGISSLIDLKVHGLFYCYSYRRVGLFYYYIRSLLLT